MNELMNEYFMESTTTESIYFIFARFAVIYQLKIRSAKQIAYIFNFNTNRKTNFAYLDPFLVG